MASFDVILSVEVVEHLNDESLQGLLATAYGLLKPGGRFIVTTPNDEDLRRSYMYSPATDELYHRWQHVRSWNQETLPRRLTEAGFRVEKTYTTNLSMQGRTRDARLRRFIYISNRLRGRASSKMPHLICISTRN
jgi:2-polyprenyl-3-methyl-5-hydroxy-6-metoxy-1,4-benzoquinol methylase